MIPLRDSPPTRSFPAINWLIIITNLLIFIYETTLTPGQLDRLVMTYGTVPARVLAGHPQALLTLFTSMFLHGGWLHVIGNLWVLYIFGDNVEDVMGSGRYLLFYLVSGIVAGLTQILIGPTSRIPAIGASGAIAGVLGAYLMLFPGSRVTTLVPVFFLPWFIEIPAIIFLGFWFILQFFNGLLALEVTTALGGIAYWAHIGGFLFGLVAVPFFGGRRSRAYYSS
jgi:membrane associated rhomboid family serine protease